MKLIKLTSWKLEGSRWFHPYVLLPDAKQFLHPITSAPVHTTFLQQSIIWLIIRLSVQTTAYCFSSALIGQCPWSLFSFPGFWKQATAFWIPFIMHWQSKLVVKTEALYSGLIALSDGVLLLYLKNSRTLRTRFEDYSVKNCFNIILPSIPRFCKLHFFFWQISVYILTFCWPCISVYLSQYLTNLMHKNLFHSKFYFMPVHVSSTCAHHQEVKIVEQIFVHQVG